MKRLQLVLLSTLACLLVGTSCSKSGGDDALANTIKASLYSDQTTKPATITVAVKGGVVTLSGDVASSDVALEAMRVANGTPGVRGVADQLTINGASAANQLPNAGNTTTAPPPTDMSTPAPAARVAAAPPVAQAPVAASPYPAVPPPGAAVQPPPYADRERERERRERPPSITIPAGTPVSVRTIDPIESGQNQAGQTFHASLNAPVTVGDRVILPAGTDATLTLSTSNGAGKIRGRAELGVVLSALSMNGRAYSVASTAFTQEGASRGKNSAVRTGIGAAAGALIGGLAGGGKGAGIGAAAGGGVGLGSGVVFKDRVKIPSETVINFRLEAPLTIPR